MKQFEKFDDFLSEKIFRVATHIEKRKNQKELGNFVRLAMSGNIINFQKISKKYID